MVKVAPIVLGITIGIISLAFVWQIHFDVLRIEIQYFFMFMALIPIFFFIYLFFHHEKILSGIKEWAYTKLEDGINTAVTERLTTKKEIADFF